MKADKLATAILAKINPIAILIELGVDPNNIPREIKQKSEEAVKQGKFFIETEKDRVQSPKFVWKFPFRHEQLVIQETEDEVRVWFHSNHKPFVIPMIVFWTSKASWF